MLLKRRYQLEKTIQQGGIARVYLATDTQQKCHVIIKQLLITEKNLQNVIDNFVREYHFFSRIDHINVGRAHDFFEEKEHLFSVWEYVPGIPLSQFLQGKNSYLVQQLAMAIQISRGLEVLNTAGFVHFDLTPDNIIVDENTKNCKVLGMGVGQSREEILALIQFKTTFGIPEYMSPEQATGKIAENSNVFSLAVILYQIFHHQAQSPFAGKDTAAILEAIQHRELPPLKPANEAYDSKSYQSISQILQRASTKDYQKRTAYAKSVANALMNIHLAISADCQDTAIAMHGKVSHALWKPTPALDTYEVIRFEEIGKAYGRDSKPLALCDARIKNSSRFFPKLVALLSIVLVATATFFYFENLKNNTREKNVDLKPAPIEPVEKSEKTLEAQEQASRKLEYYYQEAIKLLQQQKYVEAKKAFTVLIQKNYHDAWWYRAQCHFAEESFDNALDDLEMYHKIHAKTGESLYLQGNSYEKLGKYTKAQQTYLECIEMESNFFEAIPTLIALTRKTGNWLAILPTLNSSIVRGYDGTEQRNQIRQEILNQLTKLSNRDSAIQFIQKAIECDPEFPGYYAQRAVLLWENKSYQQIDLDLEKYFSLGGDQQQQLDELQLVAKFMLLIEQQFSKEQIGLLENRLIQTIQGDKAEVPLVKIAVLSGIWENSEDKRMQIKGQHLYYIFHKITSQYPGSQYPWRQQLAKELQSRLGKYIAVWENREKYVMKSIQIQLIVSNSQHSSLQKEDIIRKIDKELVFSIYDLHKLKTAQMVYLQRLGTIKKYQAAEFLKKMMQYKVRFFHRILLP